MTFRTELTIDKSPISINHHSPILLLGSCFSQNIGLKLQKYKFNCSINPFGTIFNPISLAYLINRSVNCIYEDEDSLVLSNGLWVHPNYHSQLSHVSKTEALNLINQKIETTHNYLKNCKILFLTLGTSIVYRWKESKNIVANCHKIPLIHFEKVDLTVAQMVLIVQDVLKALLQFNPGINVVFTVSPVRHIKDGIVANSFSKAKLHVLIDELKNLGSNLSYFPAYEWVFDDLRDYRFYGDDLIHPNEFAVNYIWRKFLMYYFGADTQKIIQELEKIWNDENHRPFNENSDEHQSFIKALESKKALFKEKYPYILL